MKGNLLRFLLRHSGLLSRRGFSIALLLVVITVEVSSKFDRENVRRSSLLTMSAFSFDSHPFVVFDVVRVHLGVGLFNVGQVYLSVDLYEVDRIRLRVGVFGVRQDVSGNLFRRHFLQMKKKKKSKPKTFGY